MAHRDPIPTAARVSLGPNGATLPATAAPAIKWHVCGTNRLWTITSGCSHVADLGFLEIRRGESEAESQLGKELTHTSLTRENWLPPWSEAILV